LVLDEADFAQTNENSELIHYLNCRATGTPVSRQNSKDPSVTDTFDNFGITVLTQRRGFDDNATESRAISFYSEKSDKKIPVAETDEMLKLGLQLQNMLLYLRLKFYRQIKIDKETWFEGISDSRFMAALLPMLAIAKFEPDVKEIITCNVVAVERSKIMEKANSMDGQLISFLWEKIQEGLFESHQLPDLSDLYFVLDAVETNVDDVGDRCELKKALTTGVLAEHFKWNANATRKALTSLGIVVKGLNNSVKVGKKTQRVIFFEPVKLERRLKEFVLDYTPDSIYKLVTVVTQVTLSVSGGSQKALESFSVVDGSQCKSETNKNGEFVEVASLNVVDGKPIYYFRQVVAGEKCLQCERLAVQYELMHEGVTERLCESCFRRRRTSFTNAYWIQNN
jgi:hypothetical protein